MAAVIKEAVAQEFPFGNLFSMQILTEKGLGNKARKQMVLALFQVSAGPIPASKEQPVPHMGGSIWLLRPAL